MIPEQPDAYQPCDPNSQPPADLQDSLKEPIDQWLLKHDPQKPEIIRDVIRVWTEFGQQAHEDHPDVREITLSDVDDFLEELPILTQIDPFLLSASGGDSAPAVGRVFGVPRDGGYVPLLGLYAKNSPQPPTQSLHFLYHALDDTFSDTAEADETDLILGVEGDDDGS